MSAKRQNERAALTSCRGLQYGVRTPAFCRAEEARGGIYGVRQGARRAAICLRPFSFFVAAVVVISIFSRRLFCLYISQINIARCKASAVTLDEKCIINGRGRSCDRRPPEPDERNERWKGGGTKAFLLLSPERSRPKNPEGRTCAESRALTRRLSSRLLPGLPVTCASAPLAAMLSFLTFSFFSVRRGVIKLSRKLPPA